MLRQDHEPGERYVILRVINAIFIGIGGLQFPAMGSLIQLAIQVADGDPTCPPLV